MLDAEGLLDVPHCFLDRDLGSVTRLLEIRIDDVPLVSMSLMGLAASTGHTHLLPPSASSQSRDWLPDRCASETCRGRRTWAEPRGAVARLCRHEDTGTAPGADRGCRRRGRRRLPSAPLRRR